MLGSEDMALPQRIQSAPVNEMLEKRRQDLAVKGSQAANKDQKCVERIKLV